MSLDTLQKIFITFNIFVNRSLSQLFMHRYKLTLIYDIQNYDKCHYIYVEKEIFVGRGKRSISRRDNILNVCSTRHFHPVYNC